MLIRKGAQIAEAGTYWNMRTGERVTIESQDVLPGNFATKYLKASSTAMLLLGPILGLAFAVFLPFIGIAMAISFAGKRLLSMGGKSVERIIEAGAKSIFFVWRPLQAYLANKRKSKEVKQMPE